MDGAWVQASTAATLHTGACAGRRMKARNSFNDLLTTFPAATWQFQFSSSAWVKQSTPVPPLALGHRWGRIDPELDWQSFLVHVGVETEHGEPCVDLVDVPD